MSYLQSLVLLSSHRILGHSLLDRSPPPESFASVSRTARGADAGDLVDSLVEGRLVLEKCRALESKLRYQIDKLVRIAKEESGKPTDVLSDPLAFKPNPDSLVESSRSKGLEADERVDDDKAADGIYRPPKIAPTSFIDDLKRKKRREAPPPSALASLVNYDPSNPHMESTSGLGNDPSLASSRTKELARLTRYEEEHMQRLVMKKTDARRRLMDEHDIALGGTGNVGKSGRHLGDFASEFSDVLKSIDRRKSSKLGDGYDMLRMKGKKGSALERSRVRKLDSLNLGDEGDGERRKRGRFEKDMKKEGRRKALRR
ncbi:hypothetical protein FRB99_000292 [Tulasnella sp. 403]|nr:hypothetical protein FRB99_000292 [Tulasnella sp. 403]